MLFLIHGIVLAFVSKITYIGIMFLEYAKNNTGDYFHVSEVGKKDLAFCPFCNNSVYPKRGQKVAHHFAHMKGESCRDWGVMEKVDYLLYKALTPVQAETLFGISGESGFLMYSSYKGLYLFDHKMIRDLDGEKGGYKDFLTNRYAGRTYKTRTINVLIEKGFFSYGEYEEVDYHYFRRGRYNKSRYTFDGRRLVLNELCKIYTLKSTFQEAFRFFEWQFRNVDNEAMKGIFERLSNSVLYFISIKADGRTFQKIGITSDWNRRRREIKQFLEKHYKSVSVKLLCKYNLAILEHYFKRFYSEKRFSIEGASVTEYFQFTTKEISHIRRELKRAQLSGEAHRQKIKDGLVNRSGRGRGNESSDSFMKKPKVKLIVEALGVGGKSLRQIAKDVGCSINTVQKVRKILDVK